MRFITILPCLFGASHARDTFRTYTCRGEVPTPSLHREFFQSKTSLDIDLLQSYADNLETFFRVYAINTDKGWMSYIEVWYATGAVTETGESAQPVKVLYKKSENLATVKELLALCPRKIVTSSKPNIIPAGIPEGWSESEVTVVLKNKDLQGKDMTVLMIKKALDLQTSEEKELWLHVNHDGFVTEVDLLTPTSDYVTFKVRDTPQQRPVKLHSSVL